MTHNQDIEAISKALPELIVQKHINGYDWTYRCDTSDQYDDAPIDFDSPLEAVLHFTGKLLAEGESPLTPAISNGNDRETQLLALVVRHYSSPVWDSIKDEIDADDEALAIAKILKGILDQDGLSVSDIGGAEIGLAYETWQELQ